MSLTTHSNRYFPAVATTIITSRKNEQNNLFMMLFLKSKLRFVGPQEGLDHIDFHAKVCQNGPERLQNASSSNFFSCFIPQRVTGEAEAHPS